jgi:glycosyltransferase involved in cell wall biosynthesis
VVDVMDVWPETFERVAPAWMLWPLRWMAKRVYAGADGISAVGDSYLEVVKRYLEDDRKPMYRCYHGIEMEGEVLKCANARMLECENVGETPRQGEADPRREEKFESAKVRREDERSLVRADGPLRLVYVGNMGKGYDLVTLVEAVSELIDEGHAISLDLAGKGEQEEMLQSLAQTKQDTIRFHGVVTGDALRALLANADAGVVPMFPKTYVAVPYKLADYVAAGLPVISSLKGETEELIKRYDAGWCYEAGDMLSLKRALQACAEERQTQHEDLRKQRARQMAEEHFDAGKIYPEFVAWLENIVAAKGITGEKPGAL